MSDENNIVLQDISKFFPIQKKHFFETQQYLKAVNHVNLTINNGETLGLVGESGCGKTTLAKIILNLYKPTTGNILFEGKNITNLPSKEERSVRKNIQMVFQDPFASLNPRMSIGDIIAEPLIVQTDMNKTERQKRVEEIMDKVGLNKKFKSRYPHEFSGGQRQRVMIAKALILNPKVLVCDEPVSALDVSIQSQILNLLLDLKKELGLTMLFISHNLMVVDYICDRIAVMYLGKIVELSDRESLYKHPVHPYTQALLSAIPIPDPDVNTKRIILQGEVPSPINPPEGCAFRNRCPKAKSICSEIPHFVQVEQKHSVACQFAKEIFQGEVKG
jgi:oligopeptide/dipeptide ABC transporter ATP-binding protein